jgi:hypothetical protein
MSSRTALVVTSIAAPNGTLRHLAEVSLNRSWRFYLIGDERSPRDFALRGCEFYSLERQRRTGLRFAEACPVRHYARKNIGYLLALREGAEVIVETDDDNVPLPKFAGDRRRMATAPRLEKAGWLNVYRYYSDLSIWPRGLPLDAVQRPAPALGAPSEVDCPIQQGLADDNPDVDAVYRLLMPLPVQFRRGIQVALGAGTWCPFNSQNTTWFREAFPLLYLPAYCSFRMTDIWRSLVAQRIAWEYGWSVLFHEASVRQDRNEHDLMKDFAEEVPGYLQNRRIAALLEGLSLSSAGEAMGENLRVCYEALVREGIVGQQELTLLSAWLEDLKGIKQA